MQKLLRISQTPEFTEDGRILLHINAKVRKWYLVWIYTKLFFYLIKNAIKKK